MATKMYVLVETDEVHADRISSLMNQLVSQLKSNNMPETRKQATPRALPAPPKAFQPQKSKNDPRPFFHKWDGPNYQPQIPELAPPSQRNQPKIKVLDIQPVQPRTERRVVPVQPRPAQPIVRRDSGATSFESNGIRATITSEANAGTGLAKTKVEIFPSRDPNCEAEVKQHEQAFHGGGGSSSTDPAIQRHEESYHGAGGGSKVSALQRHEASYHSGDRGNCDLEVRRHEEMYHLGNAGRGGDCDAEVRRHEAAYHGNVRSSGGCEDAVRQHEEMYHKRNGLDPTFAEMKGLKKFQCVPVKPAIPDYSSRGGKCAGQRTALSDHMSSSSNASKCSAVQPRWNPQPKRDCPKNLPAERINRFKACINRKDGMQDKCDPLAKSALKDCCRIR
ncbi:hypothetical protein QAD02_004289 [Eretmocerus hayati]|uniref:Uncharacterized protein n=1 Tax=Eretmocerus hayati TaxID=131215 RepID=A0ACC2NPA3_9HYME|nr:hypothetical protein QAD02_004289 [Eretmocerus hayati]